MAKIKNKGQGGWRQTWKLWAMQCHELAVKLQPFPKRLFHHMGSGSSFTATQGSEGVSEAKNNGKCPWRHTHCASCKQPSPGQHAPPLVLGSGCLLGKGLNNQTNLGKTEQIQQQME